MASASASMPVLAVRAGTTEHPTGDPKFSVLRAFPSPFTAEEADPFLMCDYFGPVHSKGVVSDEDEFPVGWHPHRGMDICTYMKAGSVRHADSMGHRETFPAPAMQWISVGSGIEHAEGGGTPKGEPEEGFQLWINVPSARKMDDPRYGTVPGSAIPVVQLPGAEASVLAGKLGDATGPFLTIQPVQMVDHVLPAGASLVHHVDAIYNNTLVYVYKGHATINGTSVPRNHAVRLDATSIGRAITIAAGPNGASAMLFAGKMLKQKIAWYGPFVMTTDAEIQQTLRDYRAGRFPPKRAPFDYKTIAAFPAK